LTVLSASLALAQQDGKVGKPSGVSLTIYNQNFGVVKDRRTVELANGRTTLIVEDVAQLIDPTTVHFKSLTAPNAVVVREQNYQYDLINPLTMLNKSVGKRVTIRQNLGNGQQKEITGTILAPVTATVAQTGEGGGGTSYNGLVVKTDDGKIVLNPVGEAHLHEMPEGLVSIPRLVWLVDSAQAGKHEAEVSYMTQGLTWRADYVVVLSADDKLVDVTGWVTLDNKSGATYENANLQLIAGDVRRIQPPAMRGGMGAGRQEALADAVVPAFAEESLFEYHLYSLDGTTTVRNNEQKQMTLLTANKAPCVKKFVYDGRTGFWGVFNPEFRPGEQWDTSNYKKVNVIVEVKNAKPNLGIALPKGRMRLYKADSKGSLQFVGEDEIDHTPKDEVVRLKVGDAFDIVGEHKRTNFRRISEKEVEESFEVTVKNHKSEDVTVSVIEHLWADWRITQKSMDYVKRDARTVEFAVKVPKDGSATVTYTARTKWL
jgi:hypothetical protein